MKLKKVAAICAKQGAFYLFDEVGGGGELMRQWLGDGRSAYPLSGLPVLDEENLCAMFDIPEKRRKKCILTRKPMPESLDVEDYAKGERALYDEWPTVEHNGYVVKPLSTSDDMLFIQTAYLSPLEDMADYLRGILDAEGISRPILVGQSLGGYVSQVFMTRYPGTASGFVSIDSCSLEREYYTGAELWLLKHTEGMYRSIPWGLLKQWGPRGTAESAYGRRVMAAMMADYTQDEYCALTAHGFRILAQSIEAGPSYALTCPALLLCGEKDGAGSCKRYDRAWSRKTGLPLTWVPGAGHNSNCDQPEIVNQAIETFIKERGEHHGV